MQIPALLRNFLRTVARKYYGIGSRREWNEFRSRNLNRSVHIHLQNLQHKNSKLLRFFEKNTKRAAILHNILYIYIYIGFFCTRKANIPNVDFIITTRCTLKCEQCASMMTFYSKDTHYDETFASFKNNLDNLLKNTHRIDRLQLIGGEPLLNPDLAKMIAYASAQSRVVHVITITNGTILPPPDVINAYKKYRDKNIIYISDYRMNTELHSLKTQEVIDTLSNAGLHINISDSPWMLRGDIYKENRQSAELSRLMHSCWAHLCTAYCDGELHLCSRSIGIKRNIDSTINDYVDMRVPCREDCIKLFYKDYIDACMYCHVQSNVRIPRAVQISTKENS